MKVVVYFQNGRVVEWNSELFCTSEPFKSEGENIMSRFELRTDKIEEWGIVVELFWYDKKISDDSRKIMDDNANRMIYQATMREGRFIPIVSPDDLLDVAKVFVDGEMIVWKQGTDMVNGIMFTNQEIICFSNAQTTSINRRAVEVYNYLKNARPGLSDEMIAHMIGYRWPTLKSVMDDEAANSVSEDDVFALEETVDESGSAAETPDGEELSKGDFEEPDDGGLFIEEIEV